MSPSHHKHAPWRRSILVPFWTFQILLELIMLGVLGVSTGYLASHTNNEIVDDSNTSITHNEIDGPARAVIYAFFAVSIICLILTITEIVLLVRDKLKPKTFLITNLIKTTIWTALFVWDIVAAATKGRHAVANVAGLIIQAGVMLCFWIPTIYCIIVWRRTRGQGGAYAAVDRSPYTGTPVPRGAFPVMNGVQDLPEAYKGFVEPVQTQSTDIDSTGNHSIMPRRLSYNHQRDPRFEKFRRTSYGNTRDLGVPSPDPNLNTPDIRVEYHDGEVYEMENSRRAFR